MDHAVRGLQSERLQLDEIWSFCHAKQRNLPRKAVPARRRLPVDVDGDRCDTKLIVTWHVSARADSERVQISTDALGTYAPAIQRHFQYRADHGTETKDYGLQDDDTPERRYSPMVVKRVVRKAVWGVPDPEDISTIYVERNNLTMRVSMRRFTRLTIGFSKKAENLQRALALNFMHYNSCRKHMTIKMTPAIAAGLTDRIWTLHDLAKLPDVLGDSLAA